ncbi:uncharacterized protein LOC126734912 isoform X2 [Anthonomus grandis grandis]|uniref:uncharacterized protein LOC126734912 isoform X2 n=1 Tax=Anthonomus grandis grandis TaxID=2921223 RepID=UPI002166BCB0|nr:uncharacterized protein LOC126734912 isoform X2 [Anthonomus grandis grandis]
MIKFLVILVLLQSLFEPTYSAPQDQVSNGQGSIMNREDEGGMAEMPRAGVFENAGRILGPNFPGNLAHKMVDSAMVPPGHVAKSAQERGEKMAADGVNMVPNTFEADIQV